MKVLHQVSPHDFVKYNTEEIRNNFLLDNLVKQDALEVVYTHYDRMIVGAATPTNNILSLGTYDELKSEFFLERRELGIVNVGDTGNVSVDGESFTLDHIDCLYIGKGKKDIKFHPSTDGVAKYILFSCPAHQTYPTKLLKANDATPSDMGSTENANHRTINKYIHAGGLQSCQLTLGVTNFKPGSIWNTMPAHLHDRRMEAYFYFNLPESQRVVHIMGEPHETRHMFLSNDQGIISPSWSIHCGVGTAAYSFIWAMGGENADFTDMDAVNINSLK